MNMTVNEICQEYRLAKRPMAQIRILADENECTTIEIARILVQNGFTVPKPYAKRLGLKSDGPEPFEFVPPTLEEVTAYCEERGSSVDPEAFFNYYNPVGWMVEGRRVRDWKAAVRSWELYHTKPEPEQSTEPDLKPAPEPEPAEQEPAAPAASETKSEVKLADLLPFLNNLPANTILCEGFDTIQVTSVINIKTNEIDTYVSIGRAGGWHEIR